jgi:hypothetical protein
LLLASARAAQYGRIVRRGGIRAAGAVTAAAATAGVSRIPTALLERGAAQSFAALRRAQLRVARPRAEPVTSRCRQAETDNAGKNYRLHHDGTPSLGEAALFEAFLLPIRFTWDAALNAADRDRRPLDVEPR